MRNLFISRTLGIEIHAAQTHPFDIYIPKYIQYSDSFFGKSILLWEFHGDFEACFDRELRHIAGKDALHNGHEMATYPPTRQRGQSVTGVAIDYSWRLLTRNVRS